jgi:RNA polymerase primary sigma factor
MAKGDNAPTNNLISPEEGTLNLYLKEIAKHNGLSAKREAELAVRIRKGDRKALHTLIQANLRFVVSVARNYQNQGLPLSDLINEGNIGLIRAAYRFDEKKNFKFISYAVWWIRQAILQSLANQSRIVKMPLNRVATIHRVGKARAKLEQKYRRLPNNREVAEELGIDENEVAQSMKIGNNHTSLDAPLAQGKEGCLLDIMEDEEQESIEEIVSQISLNQQIDRLLEILTEREQIVVRMYFGIGEETTYTLEEIGARANITRERVRQIKDSALEKLRQLKKTHRLKKHSFYQ